MADREMLMEEKVLESAKSCRHRERWDGCEMRVLPKDETPKWSPKCFRPWPCWWLGVLSIEC